MKITQPNLPLPGLGADPTAETLKVDGYGLAALIARVESQGRFVARRDVRRPGQSLALVLNTPLSGPRVSLIHR